MRNDYNIFAKFLRDHEEDNIRISFKDIEKIIGRKLPASAYKFDGWWSNSDYSPFMKKILKEGWKQKKVEMFIEFVEFERVYKPKIMNKLFNQRKLINKINQNAR